MVLTMSLNIADRRLRYRIGERHMCIKDDTRGLPIADCDIASAEGIRAYVYKIKGAGPIAISPIALSHRGFTMRCIRGTHKGIADCDIADGFIASGKGRMSFGTLLVCFCDMRSCDRFIAKTLFALDVRF